jgi:hypothetical protein
MKTIALGLTAAVSVIFGGAALAAGGKTYQVTGTVLEVTTSKIVVQKGTERFEIDVGPETKGSGGNFKAGDKVTITYTMSATRIENHGETKTNAPKIGAQKKEGPANRMADTPFAPTQP